MGDRRVGFPVVGPRRGRQPERGEAGQQRAAVERRGHPSVRRPVTAFHRKSAITAPRIATTIEVRLKRKTSKSLIARKIAPPTRAPTRPSAMLRTQPSPRLLTIRLASQPVIAPKNIQPRID